MTKHTPGPWFAVNYAGYNNLQAEPVYGSPDLLNGQTMGAEQAEANAKLAAAAPDLLEALKKLREWTAALTDWAGGTTLDPDLEKVDAVIKIATE